LFWSIHPTESSQTSRKNTNQDKEKKSKLYVIEPIKESKKKNVRKKSHNHNNHILVLLHTYKQISAWPKSRVTTRLTSRSSAYINYNPIFFHFFHFLERKGGKIEKVNAYVINMCTSRLCVCLQKKKWNVERKLISDQEWSKYVARGHKVWSVSRSVVGELIHGCLDESGQHWVRGNCMVWWDHNIQPTDNMGMAAARWLELDGQDQISQVRSHERCSSSPPARPNLTNMQKAVLVVLLVVRALTCIYAFSLFWSRSCLNYVNFNSFPPDNSSLSFWQLTGWTESRK
jgi:hypothetical protein